MLVKYLRLQIGQDLKLISRDSFLSLLMFVPLITGIILRLAYNLLTKINLYGINIKDYYMLIVSFIFAMVMPSLLGMMTGFLLLDEKDEGTLQVLKVTPLQPSKYLRNKMILPCTVGVGLNFIGIMISGIEITNNALLLIVLTLASLLAPTFALLIGTYANNKVEGFAFVKLLGLAFIAPLVAYFVPEPIQWIFGLLPVYWPVKGFWIIQTQNYLYSILILLIGYGFNILCIIIVFRRFKNQQL